MGGINVVNDGNQVVASTPHLYSWAIVGVIKWIGVG